MNITVDGQIDEIRSRFKPDTYKLTFKGSLDELKTSLGTNFDVSEFPLKADQYSVNIRHLNNMDTRSLINLINPVVDIVSFEELVPSMNDIFIRVVEGSNKKSGLIHQ